MHRSIQKALVVIAASILSLAAFASDKDCTELAKAEWQSKKDVQAGLEKQAYKVKRIKKEGSCYEAYVTDKEGVKRELLINPADGSVVGEEDES